MESEKQPESRSRDCIPYLWVTFKMQQLFVTALYRSILLTGNQSIGNNFQEMKFYWQAE